MPFLICRSRQADYGISCNFMQLLNKGASVSVLARSLFLYGRGKGAHGPYLRQKREMWDV